MNKEIDLKMPDLVTPPIKDDARIRHEGVTYVCNFRQNQLIEDGGWFLDFIKIMTGRNSEIRPIETSRHTSSDTETLKKFA